MFSSRTPAYPVGVGGYQPLVAVASSDIGSTITNFKGSGALCFPYWQREIFGERIQQKAQNSMNIINVLEVSYVHLVSTFCG